MRNLSQLANMSATASSGAERIIDILEATPESIAPIDGPVPRFQGHIRFDQVDFGHTPGQPVLRDISFEIEPLRRVALVGLSGSGKTTLAKLIPAFEATPTGWTMREPDLRAAHLVPLRDPASR
jgi:ABC-type multidrug transport system fused ATPase/permease subunit